MEVYRTNNTTVANFPPQKALQKAMQKAL